MASHRSCDRARHRGLGAARLVAPSLRRPLRLGGLALVLAALSACGGQAGAPAYTGTGVRYPTALVADPSGRFIYVAGANFDRANRSGVVRVIDTVAGAWLAGPPLEVPTYAAAIALQPDALGPGRHRLFVPARDDDTVTVIDVAFAKDGAPALDCGQTAANFGRCGDAWRIGGDKTGDLDIGQDPIAVSLEPGRQGASLILHVAASVAGRVTALDVKSLPSGGVAATTLVAFTPGGTGVSPSDLVRSPLSGRTYVADVRSNAIASYALEAAPAVGAQGQIVPASPGQASAEPLSWTARIFDRISQLPLAQTREFSRSMALSADGGRLYVAYRSPNALLIIDTAPDATGQPLNEPMDTIGLGGRPAQVVLAPTGPGGRELAYVSCFGTDDIWVVDPEARRVVAVIRLPHSPYGLAVANVPGRGWTLYTGLFSQHRVAVIDLDEGDPQRHEVSSFIGD